MASREIAALRRRINLETGPQSTAGGKSLPGFRKGQAGYHPRMTLSSGEEFAGFRVIRSLGSGGMGEVYLVRHPRLPRHQALKILSSQLSVDAEFRERFIREADLAAALFHPHIVGVHDRGEFNNQLWISMDYIDGTDAAEHLRTRCPTGMPVNDCSTIVSALASALDYAHDRGLLHRDVKPANVLLGQPDADDQRRILLADFGIARPLADPSGLTMTNLTVGTVAYAPPEQLMGMDLDGRADQYALAATTYHLLTGIPLFENPNPVAVISAHLNTPPPPLSERRPDLVTLNDVFATALAKNPAERFTRCRDFASAFLDAIDERETPSGASVSTAKTQLRITTPSGEGAGRTNALSDPNATADTSNTPHKNRSRVLIAAALGLALCTGIGVSIWKVRHNAEHMSTPQSVLAAPPAVLDGTYRFEYVLSQGTLNGSPNAPPQAEPQTQIDYWAMRSTCTPSGCVATGTALNEQHVAASTPPASSVWHYTNEQWQRMPERHRVEYEQCSVDGDKFVPGGDTEVFSSFIEPQADGSLRGYRTDTVVTGECDLQGVVRRDPLVVTRIGDVPPGVAVADPATAPNAATPGPPSPAVAGPELDGTYRIDYDFIAATTNRPLPNLSTSNQSYWYAFTSACTASGCVATGAELDDVNHQEATGIVTVLRFEGGRWSDASVTTRIECGTSRGPSAATVNPKDEFTISTRKYLEPQPDGTIKGATIQSIESNECGLLGYVTTIPIVATRVADVPSNVILADPKLFLQ